MKTAVVAVVVVVVKVVVVRRVGILVLDVEY